MDITCAKVGRFTRQAEKTDMGTDNERTYLHG